MIIDREAGTLDRKPRTTAKAPPGGARVVRAYEVILGVGCWALPGDADTVSALGTPRASRGGEVRIVSTTYAPDAEPEPEAKP